MRKKIPLIGGIINLIESLKGNIGIVENGDVATHSIPSGSYVIWHNELYKASSAIAVDDALSSSNLTAVSGGVGNEMNDNLDNKIAAGIRIYKTTGNVTVNSGYYAVVFTRTANNDPNSFAEWGIRGGIDALCIGGGTIVCSRNSYTYTFTDSGLGGTVTKLVIEFKV